MEKLFSLLVSLEKDNPEDELVQGLNEAYKLQNKLKIILQKEKKEIGDISNFKLSKHPQLLNFTNHQLTFIFYF